MKKYGVIVKSSRWVEGDERSRTNPGHGYPAGYESVTSFETFRDEDEMIRHYSRGKNSGNTYISYEELSFETTINVKHEVKT